LYRHPLIPLLPQGPYNSIGVLTWRSGCFRRLARAYADHHSAMAASRQFPHGITNGNKWYPVYGGMQDWNYLVGKCMDITVEADDRKWPHAHELEQLFQVRA
jgi:carboxypeptidase D